MSQRVALLLSLLVLLPVRQSPGLESGLVVELRRLLGADVDRRQFAVECTGGFERALRGERIRPRWPLRRDRLIDGASGELVYERYSLAADRAISREDAGQDWRKLDPATPLPDPFSLPRALLEALLVAASDPGEPSPAGGPQSLELDAFLTERVARTVLEGTAKLRFDGSSGVAEIERPTPDSWRARCRMSGSLDGAEVNLDVTLVIDGGDGILPYEDLPVAAGTLLALEVVRPGTFRASPRVIDHYSRERLETTLWLWFSDRCGGVAGDGVLYQLEIGSAVWSDEDGRELSPTLLGLSPDDLQGARLSWRFDDLARQGTEELNLKLRLSVNFFPVAITVSFARGAGIHENEPAWMPRQLPATMVGELPEGIREIHRR